MNLPNVKQWQIIVYSKISIVASQNPSRAFPVQFQEDHYLKVTEDFIKTFKKTFNRTFKNTFIRYLMQSGLGEGEGVVVPEPALSVGEGARALCAAAIKVQSSVG